MADFFKFDDAMLRISEISYWRWDRGHSYTKLVITMSDGREFAHSDWNGSAYELEKKLIAAIGHD